MKEIVRRAVDSSLTLSIPSFDKIFQKSPHQFDRLSITSLWTGHERLAMHCLILEKDIAFARQHFYTCGTLTNYTVLRFGHWQSAPLSDIYPEYRMHYMSWTDHIGYILLSDNQLLIEQYASLSHQWWEQQLKEGTMLFAAAVQSVLRNDREGLLALVPLFDREIKRTKSITYDKEFFLGLMEKDLPRVTEAIETLCSKKYHYHRNKYSTAPDLFSFPAVCYAKLAWLKGMQVQIDSPLVPMELMPIAPLEQYVNPYERFWRLGED